MKLCDRQSVLRRQCAARRTQRARLSRKHPPCPLTHLSIALEALPLTVPHTTAEVPVTSVVGRHHLQSLQTFRRNMPGHRQELLRLQGNIGRSTWCAVLCELQNVYTMLLGLNVHHAVGSAEQSDDHQPDVRTARLNYPTVVLNPVLVGTTSC